MNEFIINLRMSFPLYAIDIWDINIVWWDSWELAQCHVVIGNIFGKCSSFMGTNYWRILSKVSYPTLLPTKPQPQFLLLLPSLF